jgi:hypothetical protein
LLQLSGEAVVVAALTKIDALVAGVTRAEIQALPPAHGQRLAQVLRHIADVADPPKKPERLKTGVLADLRGGQPTSARPRSSAQMKEVTSWTTPAH